MDNLQKIYSQIFALRENVPQERYVSRMYVDQYNALIDELSVGTDLSLEEFKVPESVLKYTSGVSRPGVGFQAFGEKECERGFFLAKLDAVLLLFRLKEENRSIGFEPPEI